MFLDPTNVGTATPSLSFEYDWKRVVLYALGIGATEEELDFLYEARGPQVFPTFAVVACYPAVHLLFQKLQLDMTRVVHGAQSIRLEKPIPPEGVLETVGTIRGIYGMKQFVQISLATQTRHQGVPCFDTEWSLIVRDVSGFQGPRPPKNDAPKVPKEQLPSFVSLATTTKQQALLYRLSGDLNPLHADPDFARVAGFERGPLLHGLCTFGFAGRALLRHGCAGDPGRLRSLSAHFRKPVWPGESLRTEGYDLGNGRFALEVFADDRREPVLTSAWAEIRA